MYKNLNEKEFNLLLKLIKQWYCQNDDTSLFSKGMDNLLVKIRANQVKIPNYLYRAYSFQTKEDLNNFKKTMTIKIEHPNKDYESWTSKQSIAERYMPQSEYNLNRNSKYGILIRISSGDFIDNIKFTIEDLFSEKNDKNLFFKFCFSYLSSKMLEKIKEKNFNQKDIEEFQYIIPGLVRAVTESEYLLDKLIHPKPFIIKEIIK
jgi:hypothetical protein